MATTALGFDNFYTSTLSAGITASDTTVYLNALPTATEGYLVIEPDSSTQREIIYYTSRGANFVTLPSAAAGRGVGATTAQSHSSGVTAQMNVVAEHFEALQDGTSIASNAITAAKLATTAITLGYASSTSTYSATPGAGVFGDVTSLSVAVTVPAGSRAIEITAFSPSIKSSSVAPATLTWAIRESSTQLNESTVQLSTALYNFAGYCVAYVAAPSAGAHTYKVSMKVSDGGTVQTSNVSATSPAFILVKAI